MFKAELTVELKDPIYCNGCPFLFTPTICPNLHGMHCRLGYGDNVHGCLTVEFEKHPYDTCKHRTYLTLFRGKKIIKRPQQCIDEMEVSHSGN